MISYIIIYNSMYKYSNIIIVLIYWKHPFEKYFCGFIKPFSTVLRTVISVKIYITNSSQNFVPGCISFYKLIPRLSLSSAS